MLQGGGINETDYRLHQTGKAECREAGTLCKEIFKISVTNALGCGQQKGYVSTYRGSEVEVNLHKKVRLAIGVNDEFVEKTVEGIIAGARTGYIGDGKIFVLPMEECIRIRTGERGRDAIG